MPPNNCQCGNLLFFENAHCLKCQTPVGICPVCWSLTSMKSPADAGDTEYRCNQPNCGALLKPCKNHELNGNCNCYVDILEAGIEFCVFCRLNEVIPDLFVQGNLEKWTQLEVAKRRALFGARKAGFLFGPQQQALNPKLKFLFKSDHAEPVATGHMNGSITINLKEADEVERERARVAFGEPQRTLIGHFRHELGHYYWSLLVMRTKLFEFREVFGNESNPSYTAAKKTYYRQGPAVNWSLNFISAYASMHPWEDFAETFSAYLDMRAVLDTSGFFGLTDVKAKSVKSMVAEYSRIGIISNEMCRDIGLIDLVPEILTSAVVRKMEFIHGLIPQS